MNLQSYLAEYPRLLADPETPNLITRLKDRIALARDAGRKIMLAGNGASASIASHLATDFSKQGRVRAMTFNDANLITALGNDCGLVITAFYQSFGVQRNGDDAINFRTIMGLFQ